MIEVMVGYMKNMWGINEVLPEVSMQCKVPKQAAEEILNSPIKNKETARAMRKLKGNKAPGKDLTPNEIWKMLEGEGLENLVEV